MIEFFKHIITGIDNNTYDIGRFSFIITNILFLLFTGYVVYIKQTFDMQSFGIAYGAICAGFGAMIKLKQDTEPKEKK